WTEYADETLGASSLVEARPQDWGDIVIARKDVPTSYHLAVVLDDAEQRVTQVVRGRDLYHATAIQRLLQELLGLPQPAYFHHRLVWGEDGRKLSKSASDTGLRELREKGRSPDDIRRMVGFEPLSPAPCSRLPSGRAAAVHLGLAAAFLDAVMVGADLGV